MDRREQVQYLNQALLAEMPQYREQAESFPADEISQRRLLRSLMNVRPPMPLAPEFLEVQDALLSTEREEKGVVDGDALPPTAGDPRLILWQGDITRLRADAIVDADNSPCWGASLPATAASTTPSTRRRGSSSGTRAQKSCGPRGILSPPAGPS